jgi:hypothetical protein
VYVQRVGGRDRYPSTFVVAPQAQARAQALAQAQAQAWVDLIAPLAPSGQQRGVTACRESCLTVGATVQQTKQATARSQ